MRFPALLLIFLVFSFNIISHAQTTGSKILYAYNTSDGDALIQEFDPVSQTRETILSIEDSFFRCFDVSDNGNLLAYAVSSRDNPAYSDIASFDVLNAPIDYIIYDRLQDSNIMRLDNVTFRTCPQWSPDGRYFAYLTDDLYVADTDTGSNNMVMTFDSDITKMLESNTVTPSGGVILWVTDDMIAFTAHGDVYLYRISDDMVMAITSTPDINESIVSASPDGNVLAIQASATMQTEENIYLALYTIADEFLWRITDDMDGSNIVYTFGWQADSHRLILTRESDDTIFLADADSQIISPLIDRFSLFLDYLNDGEAIIYVRNQTRDESGNYSLDIVHRKPFLQAKVRCLHSMRIILFVA